MAYVVPILLDQGSTFSFTFDVTDDEGTLIDLSNHTIESQFRRHHSSETYYEFTCVGYANGSVTLSMTAAQTAAVPEGYYYWDVEATSTSNVTSRIVEGKLRVRPEITK
jgi:hypothetical protein